MRVASLLLVAAILTPVVLVASERATGRQVLVVYRSDSKDSKRIAQHYAEKRSVPPENICGVSHLGDATETIARDDFERKLQKQVVDCLQKADKSKILYILLSYGLPFRISNMPTGYGEAVDQYLQIPFDTTPWAKPNNPYFVSNDVKSTQYVDFQGLADFRRQRPSILLYSVWRLDAPTPKIADALVDKAVSAEAKGATGTTYFDRKYGPIKDVGPVNTGLGDWRFLRAAEFARRAGFRVVEDENLQEFGTQPAPLRCPDAVLYAGWYSYANYNDAFDWANGAIGLHIDSASCLNPRSGRSWCTGALLKGITVTSGAVAEPYLEGLPLPDGLVWDLLHGANVGDAFLRNTRWLRWMVINVGDPLYTPFPGTQLK
jgi:uncharacterized protein (TIGR03790 family)